MVQWIEVEIENWKRKLWVVRWAHREWTEVNRMDLSSSLGNLQCRNEAHRKFKWKWNRLFRLSFEQWKDQKLYKVFCKAKAYYIRS